MAGAIWAHGQWMAKMVWSALGEGKVGFSEAGGRYRSEVPDTKISGKIKKFSMKITIQLGTE